MPVTDLDFVAPPKTILSIINWNNAPSTIACLEALTALDFPNTQIIVVDNGSQDDSSSAITAAFPEITLLRSAQNLGFADGHRLALDAALQDRDAALFWMLNNDAFVEPNTLSEIIKAYQQFGNCIYGSIPVDIQAGRILSLPGYFLDDSGAQDRSFNLTGLVGSTVTLLFLIIDPDFVLEIHGSSFVVPLAVVRKFGFMDDIFFLYGEETDYCYRLAKQGIKCVLVPTSVVQHVRQASTTKSDHKRLMHVVTYYATRNNLIVSRRHHSTRFFLKALILLNCIPLIRDLLSYALKGEKDGAKRENLRHRYWAIRDFLLNRTGKQLAPEDYLKPVPN